MIHQIETAQEYYVVVNKYGVCILSSINHQRKDSIAAFCQDYGNGKYSWHELRKEGLRCEKVLLTINKK